MRLLSSVDNYFLSLFEKISVWFMKLTGRSNFFLTKIMFCIVVMASMSHIINRWFPILWFFPSLISELIFSSLYLFYSWTIFALCDKAEEKFLDGEKVKIFFAGIDDNVVSVIRIFSLLFTCFLMLLISFGAILNTKGIMIFKIICYMFFPASTAFLYFIAVDPPPTCRGKIREWAESFAAGFKRLALVKAEN